VTWVLEPTTKVKDNAVVTVTSLSWFKAPALVTFGICLVGIVGVVIAKAAAPKPSAAFDSGVRPLATGRRLLLKTGEYNYEIAPGDSLR
jgi:hypothetical protein